jgi:uncharacterized membrane protein YobD (UPF0266 family)
MCCSKLLKRLFSCLQVFEVSNLLQMHLCQTRILVLSLEQQKLLLVSSGFEFNKSNELNLNAHSLVQCIVLNFLTC